MRGLFAWLLIAATWLGPASAQSVAAPSGAGWQYHPVQFQGAAVDGALYQYVQVIREDGCDSPLKLGSMGNTRLGQGYQWEVYPFCWNGSEDVPDNGPGLYVRLLYASAGASAPGLSGVTWTDPSQVMQLIGVLLLGAVLFMGYSAGLRS